MSALLGLSLGAGLLLVGSPWLWPRGSGSVARAPRSGGMSERLAQAGLGRVRPGVVIAVSGALGAAVASLVLALLPVVPLALAAGLAAGALPWRVVVSRAARQRGRARTVWPDVVDQLVSAVRSGMPLPDAMATLSTVGPEITREAFTSSRLFIVEPGTSGEPSTTSRHGSPTPSRTASPRPRAWPARSAAAS